ncbi:hypothetical protein [Deinococcus radiophilus]|uniref:hypothetical protein n=1 Tax=Deinococcus radiophilus TaxID=32062 RepID=UPI00361A228A
MSRRGLAGLLLSMALLAGGASAQTDPDGNPGSGLIGTGQVVPVARPPLPAVAPDTLPEVQLSGRELSGVQGGQTVWSHAWPPSWVRFVGLCARATPPIWGSVRLSWP